MPPPVPAASSTETHLASSAFANINMFEAEEIDRTVDKVEKKMVKLGTPAAEGISLQEHGSWHFNRRRAVLQAHPKVKELYGTNPWTALVILGVFALHTLAAIYVSNFSWWVVVPVMYTLGALNAFQCQMLGHEAAHGLVFPNRSAWNKIFCIIAFMPTFVAPFAGYWLIEHMYHHNVVVDKCLRFGKPSNRVVRKLVIAAIVVPIVQVGFTITSWLLLAYCTVHFVQYLLQQVPTPLPGSFGLPPFKSFPQIINRWTILNIVANNLYFAGLVYFFGWNAVWYLLISCCISNGVHPLGMRMVQEHYVYQQGQPTYSVYPSEPFSTLTFNIGHHVEHHDFPQIPWNRLPALRAAAPEFYGNLFYYPSYTAVFKEFLTNPGIPLTLMFSDTPLNAKQDH